MSAHVATLYMLKALAEQGDPAALRRISEADFSKAVVFEARSQGFLVHYERVSGTRREGRNLEGLRPEGPADLILVRASDGASASSSSWLS
jgi:hypothetical protein